MRYEPNGFYFAPELVALMFNNGDIEYGNDTASGDLLDLDNTDLSLGWRLGLGWKWRNNWDLVFRFTSVSAGDDADATASGPAGIATNFGAGFDTAMADLDIDYFTADAEVGYTWGDWDRSNLRLFFGPRYATIDQELDAVYDPNTAVAGDRAYVSEDVDTEAIGLHVGLEGTIAFGPHWAIMLVGGGGVYDADFDDDFTRTSLDGAVLNDKFSTSEGDTISQFDASASLRWQREMYRDGLFAVRFGWEFTQWNDVPAPANLSASSGVGSRNDDLSANGPFVRLTWIF